MLRAFYSSLADMESAKKTSWSAKKTWIDYAAGLEEGSQTHAPDDEPYLTGRAKKKRRSIKKIRRTEKKRRNTQSGLWSSGTFAIFALTRQKCDFRLPHRSLLLLLSLLYNFRSRQWTKKGQNNWTWNKNALLCHSYLISIVRGQKKIKLVLSARNISVPLYLHGRTPVNV